MIFPSRAELPCELWYKIFAQLEFYDLLAVKSTCYLWDSMIRNDTEIRSAMFELPIFAGEIFFLLFTLIIGVHGPPRRQEGKCCRGS